MIWDVALRLKTNLTKDYLTLVAAGIGFYFLLATFPAIGAIVSVYGLFSDPVEIAKHMNLLSDVVPADILSVFSDHANKIASEPGKTLSLSLGVSLLLTMYSTSKGMKALIRGINMAYAQDQRRNFLSLNFVSFLLTVLMVCYFIISLTLVAGMPALFQLVHLPESVTGLLLSLRWPIMLMLAILGLEILYYFGPSRKNRHFRLISPGSIAASCFWLVGSFLFSTYVSNFYNFNEVYGSLGIGVALLFWFWLSAMTILAGAEINATLDEICKEKKAREGAGTVSGN